MITVYCGYRGAEWSSFSSESFEKVMEYLESRRPTPVRPTSIILVNCSLLQYREVVKILYDPQVFMLNDNLLMGGFGPTRRYYCRLWGYLDGGNLSIE